MSFTPKAGVLQPSEASDLSSLTSRSRSLTLRLRTVIPTLWAISIFWFIIRVVQKISCAQVQMHKATILYLGEERMEILIIMQHIK